MWFLAVNIPYEGKNEGKTFNERMNIEGKSYGYLFNITYWYEIPSYALGREAHIVDR